MNITYSFKEDFEKLLSSIREKYGQKIFDLDGTGSQLDFPKFSKSFFQTEVPADASIDPNANCSDKSVVSYELEVVKPHLKLNAYYELWKRICKLWDKETADRIITEQIIGDIYINDATGIGSSKPYCLAAGTRVITRRGHIKIEEVVEGDVVLTREGFKTVSQTHVKHDVRSYSIVTDSGRYIKSTGDHKFFTPEGWKKASDIEDGDTIQIPVEGYFPSTTYIIEDVEMDKEWGEIFGVLFRAEKVSRDEYNNLVYTIKFPDREYVLHFKSLLEKKLTALHLLKPLSTTESYFEFNKQEGYPLTKFDFTFIAVEFIKLLQTIEFPMNADEWATSRKIPEHFFKCGGDFFKGFIQGIYDVSGEVYKPLVNSELRINETSQVFLRDIQYILLNFGIYSQIKGPRRNEKNDDYYWTLTIKGLSSKDFLSKIELNSTMQEIVENANFSSVDPSNAEGIILYEEVESIDWDDEEIDFFDIGVEDSHEYIANGFVVHNCFNYSTLDIVAQGLEFQDKNKVVPPKYLFSFKSQIEQFTIIAANSTLGATGLADFLISCSYYMKNILETHEDAHFKFASEEDCWIYLKEILASFIYTMNQSLRATQSAFTNISIYDSHFLDVFCNEIIFPDGSSLDKELIKKIQKVYMDTMNEELKRIPLTFPVTTACFSIDEDHRIVDEEFLDEIATQFLDSAFLNIYMGKTSTLSSCCRLRSSTNNEFFNSLGSGSSKIGSQGVCTINFPRLARHSSSVSEFIEKLKVKIHDTGIVNEAKRKIIEDKIKRERLPLYSYGLMELDKQYSTTGVNGFYEALKYLGYDITTQEGQAVAIEIMQVMNEEIDKMQRLYNAPHNCEQIPGETVSIKLRDKDVAMGDEVDTELYSNQFIPLTNKADILHRVIVQGKLDEYFSGGSILHLNIEDRIESKDEVKDLIRFCAEAKVVYFAINYLLNYCENNHLSFGHVDKCPVCGKPVSLYTRVVGFLTPVEKWHHVRRTADFPNRVFYTNKELNEVL